MFRGSPSSHGAVGWSAVFDCGISWSYSLTFCITPNGNKGKTESGISCNIFILFCVIIYNLIHLYAIQHSEENIIIVLR